MQRDERFDVARTQPTDRLDAWEELARRAERSGAELRLREGRAWVIVVGQVTAARAGAVTDLVDELARQPSMRRVSVDLTCTVMANRRAAGLIDALRAGAGPCLDVITSGAAGRLHIEHHAA